MTEFTRQTLSELIVQARNDINSRLSGADSFLRRSVLGVLAIVMAALTWGLYGFLGWLAKQLFVATATGTWLALHASIWGLTRRAATFAGGPVTVSGTVTSTVPAGAQLRRQDGALFQVVADVTLTDVTGMVEVVALAAGLAGNTLVGAALSFTAPVGGVSGAATSGALTGGADEEVDDDLRARVLLRIRKPPQGGSKADYERWTLDVSTAYTRAWVYPRWSGPGTIGVTFVCDGRPDVIPTEDDVEAVSAAIEAVRPVCPEILVFAATSHPLNPHIQVTPNTAPIKAAVLEQIDDLLAREAEPGVVLPLSHITQAISLTPGLTDYVLVSPAANVTPAAGHMITRGTPDWT